jgi:modulator of FtsH protease HflK
MSSASIRVRLRSMFFRGRWPNWRVIVPLMAAVYLATGVYSVSTDQQAVVLRWGRVTATRVPAGVHWTWPSPIGQVITLRVRETKRLTVGFDSNQPGPAVQFLTGDRNILNIRLAVQFAINDPVAYLYRATDVNTAISMAAQGALVQAVSERQVDDLLTTEKIAVQQRVQVLAEAALARYDCGVSLLGVVLDTIQPPDEVVDAFRLVSSAREDSNRIVREAESYVNSKVPVARGDAAKLVEEARSYSTQRVDEAIGNSSRFTSVAQEYRRAPKETSTRLYLEVMEEVLPQMEKTLVGADGKTVDLQFVKIK